MPLRRYISFASKLIPGLVATAAVIALPVQTISYQGYLSEPVGTPVEGTVSIDFALYTVPTGGAPIWMDTLSVDVDTGLFSVELGATVGNPLDPSFFDVPLWLGISVESDAEMVPRRLLTAAPAALNASEAQSLQGSTAADLDQSMHVADTENPHAVTAVQTGAATQTALDAESDLRIAGDSAQSTALATHAGMPTAHHSRYADAEAVAAMGVQDDANPLHHARYDDAAALEAMGPVADTNPLHHNKYADGDAVQAVLAADGSGSTLDADLLDGLDPDNIALLANTGSAFPREVPLTRFVVDGSPVRLPPSTTDIVLMGDSFGAAFSVIGVIGGDPWTGEALRYQGQPEHGEITLRYRYPADMPSPLQDWLDTFFNGGTSLRQVEVGIDSIVTFEFRATPVYVKRTTVGGDPDLLTEETIGLAIAVVGPGDWRFTETGPPESGSGPYEIRINGHSFMGNVSLPDTRLILVGGGSGVLVRGELILHDVGFRELLEPDLYHAIEDAVQQSETPFDIEVERDGISQLNATGCLVKQVSELKQTGIGEISIVCSSPL